MKISELLKNKKVLIAAGAALLVIVAVLFTVQAIGGGSGNEQLALGDKYLSALDYDNAILSFNKALPIDHMNVRAYIGLADAYLGKGDRAKAIETLQQGYEKTSDSSIKDKLDELQQSSGDDPEAPSLQGRLF